MRSFIQKFYQDSVSPSEFIKCYFGWVLSWISSPFKEARCWQLLQTFTLLNLNPVNPVNQNLGFILIGTVCSYVESWNYCCEQRLWVCWLSNSHFWNQDWNSSQSIEGVLQKGNQRSVTKRKEERKLGTNNNKYSP